jgi:uncharacterized membrane protein
MGKIIFLYFATPNIYNTYIKDRILDIHKDVLKLIWYNYLNEVDKTILLFTLHEEHFKNSWGRGIYKNDLFAPFCYSTIYDLCKYLRKNYGFIPEANNNNSQSPLFHHYSLLKNCTELIDKVYL